MTDHRPPATVHDRSITIPLQDGHVVIVDAADYPLVAGLPWRARQSQRGGFYARAPHREGRKVKHAFMHRVILGLSPGDPIVDHINGNGLDNRRANLRTACSFGNARNKRVQRNNKAGFKGVFRDIRTKHREAFIARIRCNGKQIYIGTFDTAEAAARAYDAKARELFGEFAWLNFPEVA